MSAPEVLPEVLITRLIEEGTPAALVAEVAMALARSGSADARREQDRKRQQRSRAKRADASRDGHAASCDSGGQPPSLDKEPSPTPPQEINPIPVGGERVSAPAGEPGDPALPAAVFPRPPSVDPAIWADFLRNRKLRGLANTRSTHAGLLADLARLADDEWPPGRLIAHATTQGWARVYDPRLPTRNARRLSHAARNTPHGRSIDEHRSSGDATGGCGNGHGHRQHGAGAATPAEQVHNPRLRAALELEAERLTRGAVGE